ncbi:MAG: hypothetical protein RLY14_1373 [Planctomycetota bacterium]|jgi:hypothetical protein
MSGNLEDFLRQAAQRRQQRNSSGGQPGRPIQRPGSAQSSSWSPDFVEAEIIEAEILEPNANEGLSSRRRGAANHSSQGAMPTSLPPPRLSSISEVDQADERMAKHVKEWSDHSVSHLSNSQITASKETPTAATAADTPNEVTIDQSTNVQHREQHKSPLVAILRNKESLKSAFIVSEIFTRKF